VRIVRVITDVKPYAQPMVKLRTLTILLVACLTAGCGNVSGPATLPAALKPLATGVPSASPTTVQPSEAAFIAAARAQGIKPAHDAAVVSGAHAVCTEVTTTESDAVKQKALKAAVATDVKAYGVTPAQGTQLVILSAKLYCPGQVAYVTKALS